MQPIVGLVGGLGPEATIDYYRRILGAFKQRSPGSSPRLVIDHLDAKHVLRLADSNRAEMAEYVLASVKRLEAAGAHFAVITSNSTHLVFDAVATRSSIPLISIIETCADEAARRGLKRCALIGARVTMEEKFYPNAFARREIEIVVPDQRDRPWVHDRYVNQLVAGDFRDETRAEFTALVQRLRDAHRCDAVILGGTELPLLLKTPTVADLPALDTTGLHVAAIVQRLASA
jgi:aspartate racemase